MGRAGSEQVALPCTTDRSRASKRRNLMPVNGSALRHARGRLFSPMAAIRVWCESGLRKPARNLPPGQRVLAHIFDRQDAQPEKRIVVLVAHLQDGGGRILEIEIDLAHLMHLASAAPGRGKIAALESRREP